VASTRRDNAHIDDRESRSAASACQRAALAHGDQDAAIGAIGDARGAVPLICPLDPDR
jgi:hypothetical protein